MQTNPFLQLMALSRPARLTKGNILTSNADGSYAVATSDGATILARPLPGQTWTAGAGVFVRDGVIVDTAPALPGVTQFV
jgi:outer membrane protein assembly factor BamB